MPNTSSLLQGPEHPNPGMPYTARGFPRYCYLPDNEKGRKVRCCVMGFPTGAPDKWQGDTPVVGRDLVSLVSCYSRDLGC